MSITTLFLIAGLGMFLSASAQETLTLGGVLADTKAYYPYLEEEAVLQSSRDNLEKTLWYAYIPQVSIGANVQYQTHVPSLALNLKEPEGPADPITEQMMSSMLGRIEIPQIPKLQYNAFAQVTQLLWSGNRVSAGAEMIRANIAQQSAEAKASFEKVEDAVTELYFSLLMLDAQEKLQNSLIAEIGRQKAKAQNAFDNGVATQNDLDEIAIQEIKAQQQKEQLTESRATVLHTIGLYTGKSYDPETVTAEIPSVPMFDVAQADPDARFAPGRMTHQVLDANLRMAEANFQSAFADMLPSVLAFAKGGYGRPGLNMFAPKGQPFFIYGLTFSWDFGNFYNLGTKKLDLDNTRELVRLKRKAFELNARAELEKQQSEARQYDDLIKRDEEITGLRRRIAERAALQVESGTMTIPQKLEKETELTVALQTEEVHKIQRLRALYMAKRALGAQ